MNMKKYKLLKNLKYARSVPHIDKRQMFTFKDRIVKIPEMQP